MLSTNQLGKQGVAKKGANRYQTRLAHHLRLSSEGSGLFMNWVNIYLIGQKFVGKKNLKEQD